MLTGTVTASDPAPGREPGPGLLLLRGLVKHCPRCGGGHLFTGWFRMRDRCPHCGYRFEREEGFWLGAFVINFAVTEGTIGILLGVLIALEANSARVSLVPILAVGGVLALLTPLVCYPFARTVWSAIDLIMRPADDDRFPKPGH